MPYLAHAAAVSVPCQLSPWQQARCYRKRAAVYQELLTESINKDSKDISQHPWCACKNLKLPNFAYVNASLDRSPRVYARSLPKWFACLALRHTHVAMRSLLYGCNVVPVQVIRRAGQASAFCTQTPYAAELFSAINLKVVSYARSQFAGSLAYAFFGTRCAVLFLFMNPGP